MLVMAMSLFGIHRNHAETNIIYYIISYLENDFSPQLLDNNAVSNIYRRGEERGGGYIVIIALE